jgi:starvation-inducible DNA-binding protein
MYTSPNPLPSDSRAHVAEALVATLADSIDLHSQIKVAHWNIKGPLFGTLHPLFDTFATGLALHIDAIAERAVILGGYAAGTARHVAGASRLGDYPDDVRRDLDHARLLADRIDVFLHGVRESRALADKLGDTDTVDLLTGVVSEFEKHAWFLRATVDA